MWRALLVVLMLVAAPAAKAELIPVEHFAELEAFVAPSLSPDGTHIASRAKMGDRHFLVILPLAGGGAPAVVNVGEDDVLGYEWVNDEWLVVSIGGIANIGFDLYTTRLISVDRSGKTINRIGWKMAAQNASDVIWIAKDGSPRILLSMQGSIDPEDARFWPQVFEFDVSNGKSRLVNGSDKGVSSWIADGQGVVRAGWGIDETSAHSYLVYRSSGKGGFRILQSQKLGDSEGAPTPLLFLPDSDRAIVLSSHEGYDALHEYDLVQRQFGKKIYSVEGHDIHGVVPDLTGTRIDAVSFTDTRFRTMWLDPAMRQVVDDVTSAIGTESARLVSWSRDRNRLLFKIGDADQAGAYYLYDQRLGTLDLVAPVSASFKERKLAPVKTVRYKARDGTDISAVLTLPAGKEAKNLPLIVLPHGGPRARDSERWDWEVQFLANRGYAVIQPNYRGSTGFGAAFADLGEGEWGLKMQDDVDDAVAFLAKEGIADPKRACVVGTSYGGYVAMRAATRDGFRYRCAVSYAGVSDLAALMRYDRRFLYSKTRTNWMKRQATDFKSISPRFHAAQAHTPLLIVHGRADRVVPINQSREMAEQLKDAGKPFVYIEQKEGDHHFSRQEDRLEYLRALEAFLQEHNPV